MCTLQWLLVHSQRYTTTAIIHFRIFSFPKDVFISCTSKSSSPRGPPLFLSLHICLSWAFHKNGIIQHVVLCNWLLSQSMHQGSILFYCQIIFHGMNTPYYIYPFISWWTLWMVLLGTFVYRFCMDLFSFLLDKYTVVELPGHMVTLHLTTSQTAKMLSEEDSHGHRQSVRGPVLILTNSC